MKLNNKIKNICNRVGSIFLKCEIKSFYYNILLSLSCIFAFFLPDYFLKFFKESNVRFEFSFVIVFFIFGLILSMIKNKKVVFGVVFIFFIFEIIQLHYMAYFGSPITPFEIKKIFTETNDIIESGFAYFFRVWYILPIMIFSYGVYMFFYFKFSEKCYKNKIAYLFLIALLLVKPERAYRKSLKHFLPGPTRNSIHNTINTFSYFFVKEVWNRNNQKNILFKEYEITKIDNFKKPNIIIFLVAESMNYNHLSLYGYNRITTPNLDMLKKNNRFFYKKALSSSVSTASSLPFLFNIIREPGNFKTLFNKNNNLIKLAKENGYKTYFITSQESKILNDIGVEFLDLVLARENDYINFINKKDDNLFKHIDLILENDEEYKFIIVFQRNLHSPYEKNYEEYKKEFAVYDIKGSNKKEKMVNSYDNAVLYEDYFISNIINKIDNLSKESAILLLTSDHGQLLGEDSMYGHNILNYKVAQVPFIIYHNNNYISKINLNKLQDNISHYEISKLVGNIIGYNIINPNEDGEFYIQGNNIYFDNFIIPWIRDRNSNANFKNIDSTYRYFDKIAK